jgi:hypothetical protein
MINFKIYINTLYFTKHNDSGIDYTISRVASILKDFNYSVKTTNNKRAFSIAERKANKEINKLEKIYGPLGYKIVKIG